eukprot:2711070-Rhodomonas_salina.2
MAPAAYAGCGTVLADVRMLLCVQAVCGCRFHQLSLLRPEAKGSFPCGIIAVFSLVFVSSFFYPFSNHRATCGGCALCGGPLVDYSSLAEGGSIPLLSFAIDVQSWHRVCVLYGLTRPCPVLPEGMPPYRATQALGDVRY